MCYQTPEHTRRSLGSALRRGSPPPGFPPPHSEAGFSDSLQRNATAQARLQTRKPQPEARGGTSSSPGSSTEEPTAISGSASVAANSGGSGASENNRNQCLGMVLPWPSGHTGDKDNGTQWFKSSRPWNQTAGHPLQGKYQKVPRGHGEATMNQPQGPVRAQGPLTPLASLPPNQGWTSVPRRARRRPKP